MHHSDDEKIASWPSKNSNSRIRSKMNCKNNYYLSNGFTFAPIQFSKTGLFPKYSDDKNIAGWPSKDCNSIRRNKMNHKTYYYLLNGPTFTPIRFSPNRNLKLNQCANKLFKIKIHKFSDDEDC